MYQPKLSKIMLNEKVGKRLSVKADLAVYSHVLNASG